jgi:3-oxoacyl-[acyl-carrier protein] reductase
LAADELWKGDKMGKLNEKVAVITGGARGIGRQIALTFAAEGANIAIGDVIDMEDVAQGISNLGRGVMAVKTDVTNGDEVRNLVETTIGTFGKIDILVNNAGISGRGGILEMTEDEWDKVFNVNLKSVLFCTQAASKYMTKQKSGKIVNIASIAGIENVFFPRVALNYATSKAGVMRLTRICSKELAPYGINVNAIAPGFVPTDMIHSRRSPEEVRLFVEQEAKQTPLGRTGTPQDIANLALFLASEDSSFITGQVIAVDGGRS